MNVDVNYKIVYELVESKPSTLVLAAIHTISLKRVTHDDSTFIELSSEFSSESETKTVVEDSRYKKKEMLEDLARIKI